MFMTLIMLNFMIAVIMDTYEEVTAMKEIYKYQSRAEQNRDHFELLKFFTFFEMKAFRVLVFSQSKELDNHDFYDDLDSVRIEILSQIKDETSGS